MAKITIRQLKDPAPSSTSWPEFWQMLERLPKFKKVGRFTQIDI